VVVVGLIISAQSAEKIFLGDIPLFSCAHPVFDGIIGAQPSKLNNSNCHF